MAEAHLFVDQIEDDFAVLIGDTENTEEYPPFFEYAGHLQYASSLEYPALHEYVVALSELPVGIKEGNWLTVQVPDNQTTSSFLVAVQEGREKMPDVVLNYALQAAMEKQVQSRS